MNPVLETIKQRRSIRSYKPDPVPEELLEKILEAGTYAASGMGAQASVIVAVTRKEIRDRLEQMDAQVLGSPSAKVFYGAPAAIAVLADKNRVTYVNDGSLVLGNMMLAAESLGLGSCWIHRAREVFETEEGKKILSDAGVSGDLEGIGFLIVGYPEGEKPAAKPRKDNYIYHID